MRRWGAVSALVVQLEMHGLTNRLEHLENAIESCWVHTWIPVVFWMLKGLHGLRHLPERSSVAPVN